MTGTELRELRRDAGLSLREAARRMGRDPGHLSRVESGHRAATPALVQAYRQLATSTTVDDMRRRDVLALGAAVPLLGTLDIAPRAVGAADVAAVRAVAVNLDMTHPLGVHAARAALEHALTMLEARATNAVRADLHSAVALLADQVGWGLHGQGHDGAAILRLAQQLAAAGSDDQLRGHILVDLASVLPHPGDALAVLDHALNLPMRGAERVNVHGAAARIAAQHDPRAAREHLAHAVDLAPEPGDGLAAYITDTPGHVDMVIALAAFAMNHRHARRHLDVALARLPSQRGRSRARCHARLAALDLRDGDPAAAERHLDIARTDSSTLVAREVAAAARGA